MKTLCIDASVVIKWIVPESESDVALDRLREIKDNNISLLAPSLLDYEIGSVLRQKVTRGFLEAGDVYPIIERYKQLDILLLHLSNLVFQAVSVADTLKQPSIYDIGYLLIAKQQKTLFLTADKKFYKSASPLFPEVLFFQNKILA